MAPETWRRTWDDDTPTPPDRIMDAVFILIIATLVYLLIHVMVWIIF